MTAIPSNPASRRTSNLVFGEAYPASPSHKACAGSSLGQSGAALSVSTPFRSYSKSSRIYSRPPSISAAALYGTSVEAWWTYRSWSETLPSGNHSETVDHEQVLLGYQMHSSTAFAPPSCLMRYRDPIVISPHRSPGHELISACKRCSM